MPKWSEEYIASGEFENAADFFNSFYLNDCQFIPYIRMSTNQLRLIYALSCRFFGGIDYQSSVLIAPSVSLAFGSAFKGIGRMGFCNIGIYPGYSCQNIQYVGSGSPNLMFQYCSYLRDLTGIHFSQIPRFDRNVFITAASSPYAIPTKIGSWTINRMYDSWGDSFTYGRRLKGGTIDYIVDRYTFPSQDLIYHMGKTYIENCKVVMRDIGYHQQLKETDLTGSDIFYSYGGESILEIRDAPSTVADLCQFRSVYGSWFKIYFTSAIYSDGYLPQRIYSSIVNRIFIFNLPAARYSKNVEIDLSHMGCSESSGEGGESLFIESLQSWGDRTAADLPAANVYLSSYQMGILSDVQKSEITAKGYTLTEIIS